MIILGFGIVFKTAVQADWWDRSDVDRPVWPREELVLPTNPPQPTAQQPTNVPNQPTVTPPRQGGPEVSVTPAPTSTSSIDDNDPCADGKTYTGEYCGWTPRIGGNDPGNGGDAPYDPGDPQVLGLSNTAGEDVGISDIMLLSGILCLLLYAKSKFAPSINAPVPAKRRSR